VIAHWDDVRVVRREEGHIRGDWQSLTGDESVTVGVKRIRVPAGAWSTPLHLEGSEEEIFFVLDGTGVSVQRVGDEEQAFTVRAGDCLVHLALVHAHTLQAGADGIDVLAFGQPGKLHNPPHCHNAEEEIFVVTAGAGTLELWHGATADGPDEEHPVRAGSVIARPAGTGVAHAFCAGEEGLALLAYGTRDPRDITYYPRSRKVSLRGLGVIGRLDVLDYWDGED
jgi:uncharacterized cupin superfamily protein